MFNGTAAPDAELPYCSMDPAYFNRILQNLCRKNGVPVDAGIPENVKPEKKLYIQGRLLHCIDEEDGVYYTVFV